MPIVLVRYITDLISSGLNLYLQYSRLEVRRNFVDNLECIQQPSYQQRSYQAQPCATLQVVEVLGSTTKYI